MSVRILIGDARERLKELPDRSVHCCVTSPPYFRLRDYGAAGQIGLEATPDVYVAELVAVFREVRRVLRDDGTLWLNLGESYAHDRTYQVSSTMGGPKHGPAQAAGGKGSSVPDGLKPKDLIGIPWRAAFALQADGWYLRQWLPWVKRNPMPESVRDRPTVACETVFMLTKSASYFYDYDAVRRGMAPASEARLAQDVEGPAGSARANGGAKTNGAMKAVRGDKQRGHGRRHQGFNGRWDEMERKEQRRSRAFRQSDLFFDSLAAPNGAIATKEGEIFALDVATQGFGGAHFAVMPPRLCEPLIKASCPPRGTALDPFAGAGTTGLVAEQLQRNAILIELNPAYAEIAQARLKTAHGFLSGVVVEDAA